MVGPGGGLDVGDGHHPRAGSWGRFPRGRFPRGGFPRGGFPGAGSPGREGNSEAAALGKDVCDSEDSLPGDADHRPGQSNRQEGPGAKGERTPKARGPGPFGKRQERSGLETRRTEKMMSLWGERGLNTSYKAGKAVL